MVIPDWIVQVIIGGGGGAVIAWGMFAFLGKSWVKNQFAKDLEEAKAEISLLSSRRMKLHDKEYEVFPEMWEKLTQAFNSLERFIISFRQTPDFTRMTESKLKEWVEGSDLSDDEKSYFLETTDKHKAYMRILDFRDIHEAGNNLQKFHEHLQSNRIFLNPDIKDKFDEIDGLIRKSWAAKKINIEHPDDGAGRSLFFEAFDTYEKEIKPLMKEIEILIQNQLFPVSKTGTKGKDKIDQA
ncbi:MAG: hypothetical protein COB46_07830 [Rhodospirillaceae bacterium]|nr:MAG: hypothetical protein COB46_07830 [Rhodospirillaceae bacterium]